MAEVVGLVASIVTVIEVSAKLVGVVKHYIETYKDAPKDLHVILNEASTLKTLFKNLQFLINSVGSASTFLGQLEGPAGPIEGYRSAITNLEALVGPAQVDNTKSGKRRKLEASLAQLAWPLKETKARKLLGEITRYKVTINLALSSESAADTKHVRNELSHVRQVVDKAEVRSILDWLVSVDPSPNHNRAYGLHESQTSKWILRSPDWLNWVEFSSRFLWIYGIPGAGKTILASYLISQLDDICAAAPDFKTSYAYYYCYHGRNHDETCHILRWIMNQLCRRIDRVPSTLQALYRKGTEPSKTQLLATLKDVVASFDQVYIVVDALDESQNRGQLARTLRDLVADTAFINVRLLVLSRNEADISTTFTGHATVLSMSNTLVDQDIASYIQSVLKTEPRFRRWPETLRHEVQCALQEGAKGMFRWVACQLDIIKRAKTQDLIRKYLKELPETLDETYERVLIVISPADRGFMFHMVGVLSWYPGSSVAVDELLGLMVLSCRHESKCFDIDLVDTETVMDIGSCLLTVSLLEYNTLLPGVVYSVQ